MVLQGTVVNNNVINRARNYSRHPTGYVQREREKQAMCMDFDPSSMMVRVPISSSIGHIEGLGLFTKYTPGSTGYVVVDRILIRVRPLTPKMTNICWQYDGKLNCCLLAAAKWNRPSEMDVMEKTLRKWVEIAIA
ncbi:hypothetical protein GYMLUDRAFT_237753 [Collybiopsis luxurians FD-317 M1]|nr:hypothetical protein GYMLUDRAFT_237753 [Collybiopsis luxurians FD-317 M1]